MLITLAEIIALAKKKHKKCRALARAELTELTQEMLLSKNRSLGNQLASIWLRAKMCKSKIKSILTIRKKDPQNSSGGGWGKPHSWKLLNCFKKQWNREEAGKV